MQFLVFDKQAVTAKPWAMRENNAWTIRIPDLTSI